MWAAIFGHPDPQPATEDVSSEQRLRISEIKMRNKIKLMTYTTGTPVMYFIEIMSTPGMFIYGRSTNIHKQIKIHGNRLGLIRIAKLVSLFMINTDTSEVMDKLVKKYNIVKQSEINVITPSEEVPIELIIERFEESLSTPVHCTGNCNAVKLLEQQLKNAAEVKKLDDFNIVYMQTRLDMHTLGSQSNDGASV